MQAKARPELVSVPDSLDGYDEIYLGFPNYWRDMPMAVYPFLEKFDWSGKTIHPFCTHERSALGRDEIPGRRLAGDMKLFQKEGIDANQNLMNLITEFAERKQATPAQIALAWEITKEPYLIPIPGTTKKERVKENFETVNVELSPEEMREIEEALSHIDIVGMGRR